MFQSLHLADVGRNEVADKLLHVVVDGTTFLNGGDDGGEVVIGQDHLSGRFGHGGTRAHGDTNFGLLQGRSVVDTITSHGRDLTHRLQVLDDLGLVGGFHAGEEAGSAASFALLIDGQVVEFATGVRQSSRVLFLSEDANATADGLSGGFVVASDDNDADTGLLTKSRHYN